MTAAANMLGIDDYLLPTRESAAENIPENSEISEARLQS